MFKCDILEERKQRQRDIYKAVEKLLRANLPSHHLKKEKCVNDKAVNRCLEDGTSLNNLNEESIYFAARLIAVSSTRQGSLDEMHIIEGINIAIVDMSIEKPEKVIRIDGIEKSIDAVLKNHNGAVIGHVFCKVVDGGGGHQDNVKDEAIRFLDHASKQNDGKIWCAIIDGNPVWNNQQEPYLSENVWAGTHVEIQEKLAKRFGIELIKIDKTTPTKNSLEPLEEFFDAN